MNQYRRVSPAWAKPLCIFLLAGGLSVTVLRAAAEPPPAATGLAAAVSASPASTTTLQVELRDAYTANRLREKLEEMKKSGSFKSETNGNIQITFVTSGSVLLAIGPADLLARSTEIIQRLAFLDDRPQPALRMNLRVAQITGPVSADVIRMSEAVRQLVEAQRDELLLSLFEVEAYLSHRVTEASDPAVAAPAYRRFRQVMPQAAARGRLTIPELLLLLTLEGETPPNRSGTGPNSGANELPTRLEQIKGTPSRFYRMSGKRGEEDDPDFPSHPQLDLPLALERATDASATRRPRMTRDLRTSLSNWMESVTACRAWCRTYQAELKKGPLGLNAFREALDQPGQTPPWWLKRRLKWSLNLTERLYPELLPRHAERIVRELERRYASALTRAQKVAPTVQPLPEGNPLPGPGDAGTEGELQRVDLAMLKASAEALAPAPLALVTTVADAAKASVPTSESLLQLLEQYAAERRKVVGGSSGRTALSEVSSTVDLTRLQGLETELNLWLRHASEALGRALEDQFYSRYSLDLRLLSKRINTGDPLSTTGLDQVPDVVRAQLLSEADVTVTVSNSLSLQFATDETNKVEAGAQAVLPEKTTLQQRLSDAGSAKTALDALSKIEGLNIDSQAILNTLLAGGQAVPVQNSITLSAKPSISLDGSTLRLFLTASQTLDPKTPQNSSDPRQVADRTTSHKITDSVITALSYEPMVLSSLASDVSYYRNTGGIPVLRKVPLVKELLNDIPVKPFKQVRQRRGVYQTSVLILEPVVIPTVETLVRGELGLGSLPKQ